MSYDLHLVDPVSRETVLLEAKHSVVGGTYALGGTRAAWVNITYNYVLYFRQVLGEAGIRSLYGKTAQETIPLLERAIAALPGEPAEDYWHACPGNARQALEGLLFLAQQAPPDSVWDGD